MKLSASLLALYIFQYHVGVTTGFNQISVSPHGKAELVSTTSLKSSTDYLGKLSNDRLSNDMQPVALKSVQTEGQRLGVGREGPRVSTVESCDYCELSMIMKTFSYPTRF